MKIRAIIIFTFLIFPFLGSVHGTFGHGDAKNVMASMQKGFKTDDELNKTHDSKVVPFLVLRSLHREEVKRLMEIMIEGSMTDDELCEKYRFISLLVRNQSSIPLPTFLLVSK